jgi:hypothetical protein
LNPYDSEKLCPSRKSQGNIALGFPLFLIWTQKKELHEGVTITQNKVITFSGFKFISIHPILEL